MQSVHRRTLRLAHLALAALLAFTVLAAAHQTSAQAQTVADPDFWRLTPERQATVNRLVYSQSPQAIPSSYDPVAEAEQILRQRQATLPPTNPQAPSVWQQIRGITVKSALSTPPRALGTIALAAGVFEVGWKIGSFANAKFLRLGVPPATDGPQNYQWNKITWRTARSGQYSGAYYPAQDGWVPVLRQTCCRYSEVDRWFNAPCTFSGFVPPAPFATQGPEPSTASCYTPNGNVPVDVYYGWAPENALGAPAPIEPYTNQPYTKSSPAPTPPPQTTVEQSIERSSSSPGMRCCANGSTTSSGHPARKTRSGSASRTRKSSSRASSSTGRSTPMSSHPPTRTPWSTGETLPK